MFLLLRTVHFTNLFIDWQFSFIIFNLFSFFICCRHELLLWGITGKDMLPFCRLFIHSANEMGGGAVLSFGVQKHFDFI